MAVAGPLRCAIWNWIIYFPSEFNEAIRTRGRLEGAPERVFDILYNKSLMQANTEQVMWPTLCTIVSITADRISSELHTATGRGLNMDKLSQEMLRHAASPTKLSECAVICGLDMCRAASYISGAGVDEINLRERAYDNAHEIKVCLQLSLACLS